MTFSLLIRITSSYSTPPLMERHVCLLAWSSHPFFSISIPILFLEVGTLTSVLLAIQHTFSGLLTIHVDDFAKATVNLQRGSPKHLLLLQGPPLSPSLF